MCVSIYMAMGLTFTNYNYDVCGGGTKCNPHDWHKIDCLQLLYNPQLLIIIYNESSHLNVYIRAMVSHLL